MTSLIDSKGLKSFRILRALRPLRALSQFEGMKVCSLGGMEESQLAGKGREANCSSWAGHPLNCQTFPGLLDPSSPLLRISEVEKSLRYSLHLKALL